MPCGPYLFDHRQADTKVNNQTLREWFVNEMFLGPTGLGSPAVSGFSLSSLSLSRALSLSRSLSRTLALCVSLSLSSKGRFLKVFTSMIGGHERIISIAGHLT